MNDERIPNVDPASWAFDNLNGQTREWTPRVRIRDVTESDNVNQLDGLIRADATDGNITLTLESAVGADGRIHYFKKIDSSANTVTIDGNSSEEIDGATTKVLSSQYNAVTIVSNGTGWDIVGEV